MAYYRGVINGKADKDKAATLPKFSDTLTLSHPGGVRLCPPIGFACLKNSMITPLILLQEL